MAWRHRMICAVGAAVLSLAAPIFGQSNRAADDFRRELDTLVPELMRAYGARGVAVAVIEKGNVAHTRYYGFADAEKRVPWSAATVIQPASVAKSMTAAGVMLLVQDGVVRLDDPLFERVTKWRPPPSQFALHEVTIARVLSHTSGLSRWTTGIWTVNDRLPSLAAALSGDSPEKEATLLVHEPGSKFSYSGAGYSLLQLLVEETTGEDFPEYMQARVLRPMGLLDSRIGWPPTPLPNEVKTYDEFGQPLANYRTVELGAGGWNTTLPDFAKFTASFARVNWGKGALSAASIQRMMTPAPNGKVTDNIAIGHGLYIETLKDGRRLVGHTGGNPGIGALFSIDPESGDGLAILVNRSWGHHIYGPIACAWRNHTRAVGAEEEQCPRDPTGIIMNEVATNGLAAGKQRFDALYAADPDKLAEQNTAWMVGRFLAANRAADAVAVVRWHPALNKSATLQEQLGDALLVLNDRVGAEAAWTQALRLEPGREGIKKKLQRLSNTVPERG